MSGRSIWRAVLATPCPMPIKQPRRGPEGAGRADPQEEKAAVSTRTGWRRCARVPGKARAEMAQQQGSRQLREQRERLWLRPKTPSPVPTPPDPGSTSTTAKPWRCWPPMPVMTAKPPTSVLIRVEEISSPRRLVCDRQWRSVRCPGARHGPLRRGQARGALTADLLPLRKEGQNEGRWVLSGLRRGDRARASCPDERSYYDLESFWGHGEGGELRRRRPERSTPWLAAMPSQAAQQQHALSGPSRAAPAGAVTTELQNSLVLSPGQRVRNIA